MSDEQAKQKRCRELMIAAAGTQRLSFSGSPSSLKKDNTVKDEPRIAHKSPQGMHLSFTNQPIHPSVADT